MPNLLFLYTDEQRADTLACYRATRLAMPHLNRFAEEATVFQRAYCTQPVCTPSRGSINTGLYPHSHGASTNNVALRPETRCLPERLPAGRWTCAHHGKWHLGDEIYPQHGFVDWRATEDTYHRWYAPPHDELTDRSAYHHWLVARGVKPRDLNATLPPEKRNPVFENRFFREQIHAFPEELSRPAFLADQAINYIRAQQGRPWVLYVNFLEPHPPFHSCRDQQYAPEQVDLPPNFLNALSPGHSLRARITVAQTRAKGGDGHRLDTEAHWRAMIARYWGMNSLVDAHVGRILDEVRAQGLWDDTIIVFTSDHGDLMGSHGTYGKGFMFEESAMIPLLIRLPGQKSQRRVAEPVSQIDLVPTLLDLLGEPVPAELPGASLRPQLEGGRGPTGRDVFIEWNSDWVRAAAKTGQAAPEYLRGLGTPEQIEAALGESIRTVVTPDAWKLNWSTAGGHELFDLNSDPQENRNLVAEPAQRARVADMAGRIQRWQQRTGDRLPLPAMV